MPTLNDLAAASQQNGIVVLSVHATGTSAEDVKAAIAHEKIKYPVCIDTALGNTREGRMFNYDRVMELPSAIVIDRTGNIAAEGSLGKVLKVANELAAAAPTAAPKTAPVPAPAAAPTISPAVQLELKQVPMQEMNLRVRNGQLRIEMGDQILEAKEFHLVAADGGIYLASVADDKVKLSGTGTELTGNLIAFVRNGKPVVVRDKFQSVNQELGERFRESQADAAGLSPAFGLAAGQIIRLIKPPFPAARQKWEAEITPLFGGDISSGAYWSCNGNNEIQHRGLLLPPDDRGWTRVAMATGIGWWSVDAQPSSFQWSLGNRDLVFRESATARQKMDALADLVSSDVGKRIRVAQSVQNREWIVLKGKLSRPGLPIITGPGKPIEPWTKDPNRIPAIVLSSVPADAATVARWEAGLHDGPFKLPDGMTAIERETAFWHLGVPLFNADGQPDGSPRVDIAPLWLATTDVLELKPNDPDLKTKVQRVLDNIKLQVGGEWKIENRPTDIYSLREDAIPATGPAAQAKP